MDDLINRQAAIDTMTNILWHYPNECYRNLNEYEFAKRLAELGLKSVPSAQPETCKGCKHIGKWNAELEYGYPSPCTGCKRSAVDNYEK